MMLQIFLSHLLLLVHPFFVSVTEIKHNKEKKRIEVATKIFFNDFEDALEKNYKVQLDILKPSDKKRLEVVMADYLKRHLILKVDGKPLSLNYLGYEIEEDACWCYLEVSKLSKVKKLEVVNDILFSEKSSQTNILQVTLNGSEQSVKLDNPQSLATFK